MSNTNMDTVNEIGLAVIGCGTIGRIRAKYAREYPGVKWLGLCDINDDLGKKLKEDTNADFYTNDFNELINRPEVNAVMIITDENKHTEPTLCAVEKGHKLFIEKHLATEARDSLEILNAIEMAYNVVHGTELYYSRTGDKVAKWSSALL